jgi:intracellular septation protein
MSTANTAAKPHGGWSLAVDYLPLILFFFAYRLRGVIVGTAVFMAAIVLAVIVSRVKLGRVSPMLWLSAALVVGFGGLTIYFHDPRFIQIKVTLIYTMFATILIGGLMVKKPMLRYLLQAAFPGLDETGWLKLSRNWAIFFAAMAIVNEVLRAKLGFDAWLTIKTWGLTIASMGFGAANVPMLLRHGLTLDEAKADPPLPPES